MLKQHWEVYAEAAEGAGLTPSRADWVVIRNIMVADTDEAAMDLVVNGEMGRIWREHTIKVFRSLNLLGNLLPGVDPDDVNVEKLADQLWLVGSPETVAQKIEAFYEETGGFGTIAGATYDYGERSEEYRRSFELIGTEVMPRVAHLTGGAAVAV